MTREHDRTRPELDAQALPERDAARDAATAPQAGLRIDATGRKRIGRNLRLLYADVLNQPLPDRFTKLLDDLAAGSPPEARSPEEGS